MDRKEILLRVASVIKNHTGVNHEADQSRTLASFDFDSLDLIEFELELEIEFGVDLPKDFGLQLETRISGVIDKLIPVLDRKP